MHERAYSARGSDVCLPVFLVEACRHPARVKHSRNTLTLTWVGYCISTQYLAVVCETGKGKDLGRARQTDTREGLHGRSFSPPNSRNFLVGGGSTSTGALLPGWAGHRSPAGGSTDTCQAPADELLCASTILMSTGRTRELSNNSVFCPVLSRPQRRPQASHRCSERLGRRSRDVPWVSVGRAPQPPVTAVAARCPLALAAPGAGPGGVPAPAPQGCLHSPQGGPQGCSTGCLSCRQGSAVCRPSTVDLHGPPQPNLSPSSRLWLVSCP